MTLTSQKNSRTLVLYGAGGFAQEVAWLASSVRGGSTAVSAFIDDDPSNQGSTLNDLPVLSLDQASQTFPGADVVVAVGRPDQRREMQKRARESGFRPANLVAPDARMSGSVEVGQGSVICSGCTLTTQIRLGAGVQLNLDCTVGHDVVMEDWTTLAPGVHVSGWVQFGEGVYVGTGAVIINGTPEEPLRIGKGAIVGAAACVTDHVAAGSTVVGIPARPI